MHGKRAILESDRKPKAAEVVERVHEHFGCERRELIAQDVA